MEMVWLKEKVILMVEMEWKSQQLKVEETNATAKE